VSLAEIIETFLPRGYFFPVTPGTQFITIGGAIAADVHGKNHHHSGSMSAWLLDFRLMTASGEVLDCSRERHANVFWATVGAMGLTGVILDARIRLQPVETSHMNTEHEQLRNLDELLERSTDNESDYAYSVAWIDCLSRGRALGRSVLLRANHAPLVDLPAKLRDRPLELPTPRTPRVPFTLPNFALSRPSMRLFNEAYYRTHFTRHFVSDCRSYFYPLDSIRDWNRGYGSRGVVQYQCLLPQAVAREGLIEILERLSSSGFGSFLAVLKSMGPASGGLLSFPYRGQTLALDLPFSGDSLRKLTAELDKIVLRFGGRVYLAKDSCLNPETFAQMYPEADAFRALRASVDPNQRFSSSLARRVGLAEPL
jgi:FAD/FMN-containing dehydrogenase